MPLPARLRELIGWPARVLVGPALASLFAAGCASGVGVDTEVAMGGGKLDVRGGSRVAFHSNRLATEIATTCAVFGDERAVRCWGFSAQHCGERSCLPDAHDLPHCRAEDSARERCAVAPLPRPFDQAAWISLRGWAIVVGKVDGRVVQIAPGERRDVEIEQEYPLGLRTFSAYGYQLHWDGRVVDRIGLSPLVPHDAAREARMLHIDRRFSQIVSELESACGIGLDQAVYCWGDQIHGYLGVGHTRLEPCVFLDTELNQPGPPSEASMAINAK